MANNYLQFSEVIPDVTEEEWAWWKNLYLLTENIEEDHPDYEKHKSFLEELGVVGDDEVEQIGWGFEFSNDHEEKSIWIRAEEAGDPNAVGIVVHAFFKKFRPDSVFRLTWAETCSKLRVSEFSGGTLVVDADGWKSIDAGFLSQLGSVELGDLIEILQEKINK